MKIRNILLTLIITLFTSSLFAEINEPGSGKINYLDDFEKWYTKQLKKAQKKKQKLILYGSTSVGGWAAGQSFTKEINDKSHAKAYKLCMKNAKKWTQKDMTVASDVTTVRPVNSLKASTPSKGLSLRDRISSYFD